MDYGKRAVDLFNQGYNCSQSIVLAFKDELGLDEKTLKSLASSFGGGISRLREVCGVISAMAMILGIKYGDYDILNNDDKANHYKEVQELALKFKNMHGSYICSDLLNIPQGPSNHVPEERTKSYYVSRPCHRYIYDMANLIYERIIKD